MRKAKASASAGIGAPVENRELSLGNRIQHSIADQTNRGFPLCGICVLVLPSHLSLFPPPSYRQSRAVHALLYARPFPLAFSKIQRLCSPPMSRWVCPVVGVLGFQQSSEGCGQLQGALAWKSKGLSVVGLVQRLLGEPLYSLGFSSPAWEGPVLEFILLGC